MVAEIYRYPLDLGRDSKRYPYVRLTAISFRDRIIDFAEENTRINTTNTTETDRLASFYLAIPEEVGNSNTMNWEMTDVRALAALSKFLTKEGSIIDKGKAVVPDIAAILFDKQSKVFLSQTPNPKKQALFNGIEPRTFTFNFTFTPQDLQEAETIQRIVEKLTYYSLPSLENENAAFFQFPNEFEIEFYNVAGYPKYSNCVCTNVQTNLTPAGVNLLQSGHSIQTKVSLSFLETELLRKEKPGI